MDKLQPMNTLAKALGWEIVEQNIIEQTEDKMIINFVLKVKEKEENNE